MGLGELFQAIIAGIRERNANTHFTWTKKDLGDTCNNQADQLAKAGTKKPTTDLIDTTRPNWLTLFGAKLSTLTQRTAYKLIQHQKIYEEKYQTQLNQKATLKNLDTALGEEPQGCHLNIANLWRSLRNRDIPRRI